MAHHAQTSGDRRAGSFSMEQPKGQLDLTNVEREACNEAEKQALDGDHIVPPIEPTIPLKADRLNFPIAAVIAIGGLERAAYYAVTTPWQNYMQNDLAVGNVPGALGLGQSTATAISNAFSVYTALVTIPLAVVADVYVGRYKVLVLSIILCACGCLLLVVASLPSVLEQTDTSLIGLVVAMGLIGTGTGGVRAVYFPFLGDQYRRRDEHDTVRERNGTAETVDYGLTLQLIYSICYGVINVACLSTIPSTFLERTRGFWTAYALATAFVVAALTLLLITSNRLVKLTPGENILLPASKVLVCAARNGFQLQRAKADYQISRHGHTPKWTDGLVDEVSLTLHTCRILLSFIVFYLCTNQMNNNLISQAGQMRLSNLPNDIIPTFAAISCIILAPIIQAATKFLARRGIVLSATLRVTVSFGLCGVAIGYACLAQHLIYISGPCYDRPGNCDSSRGPNDISVFVQIPTYVIVAVAEILGFITASEYAYSRSPKEARSMIQALSQLAAALGSALGLATSPAAKDPYLVIYYACLAGVMVVSAGLFWWAFHNVRKTTGSDGGE